MGPKDSQSSLIELSVVIEDDARVRCIELHRSTLLVVVCSFATFSLCIGFVFFEMHGIRWQSVEQSAPLIAHVMQTTGRLMRLVNKQSS